MRQLVIVDVVIGLVAAMGSLALTLALVGLNGLMLYDVTRRPKEIGIRMAIGAGRSQVLRMVLAPGISLTLAGLGIGLVASLGATRVLAAIFPVGGRVGEIDPSAFPLLAAAVVLVTLAAAVVPARRASSVAPIEALRYE